jgi:hypothetical protein
VYSDSDWARDVENRISVNGFIIHLLEVLIFWSSKDQQRVTLSGSEAEYVAMSEAVKEIHFISYLLIDMINPVKWPTMVSENIGSITMTENANSGVRTRHIEY